jgi:4-hydroxybenzoate polyprenyltransferase
MRFRLDLQSPLKGLLFGNLWVALMAVCMLLEASWVLELPLSGSLCLFVFSATLSFYTLDRLLDSSPALDARSAWYHQHRRLLWVLSLSAAALALLALWQLPRLVIAWLVVPALVAILYALPRQHLGFSIKNSGWLKPLLIAWVWLAMGPALLLVVHRVPPNQHLVYLTGYLLFILALCLPFDQRDQSIDLRNGINTPARQLNEKRLGLLIGLLLLLSSCFMLLADILPAIPLMGFTALAWWVCVHSMRQKSEFWYLFAVDGLIAAHAGLLGWWGHLS